MGFTVPAAEETGLGKAHQAQGSHSGKETLTQFFLNGDTWQVICIFHFGCFDLGDSQSLEAVSLLRENSEYLKAEGEKNLS